jgi:DNA-binding transcriptional regulator LsrR (DeoR family)
LSREDFMSLRALAPAGDILYHYYDIEGHFLETTFENRLVCLGANEIRKVPYTLTAVCGLEKRYALLGGLRTGITKYLVVDDLLAEEVLRIKDLAAEEYRKKISDDVGFGQMLSQL